MKFKDAPRCDLSDGKRPECAEYGGEKRGNSGTINFTDECEAASEVDWLHRIELILLSSELRVAVKNLPQRRIEGKGSKKRLRARCPGRMEMPSLPSNLICTALRRPMHRMMSIHP